MNIIKNINKTDKISHYFLIALFTFSSTSLFAEKHDHDDDHNEHNETAKHSSSEHKEKHSDHNDEKPNKKNDDHNDEKHKEKGESDHNEEEEEAEDDGHGHGEAEAETDVELNKKQRKQAGIETMPLIEQSINDQISALGEVKLNQYRTINVSPSITTRVEKRHVYLGDQVKKGDLLATLHTISTTDISANVLATADLAASSAELAASIAEAKGELAAANDTWQRIQSLGRDAVSGKRYTAARIAKEQAQAKLRAYGKSQSQVKNLIKSGSKSVQKHFELRAEQAGTIIKDNFVLGQIVNPEDVLFKISDIDHPWVEAMIKPKEVGKITVGSKASILSDGKTLQGKVIFIGRILDEKTRTLPVRIEVNAVGKSATALYPGLFVKTRIQGKASRMAITVPAEAVLRSADGDWVVFVEQASGRFVPKEIEIVENLGNEVIIKGIDSGINIVSKGAFFVQSELAKSGFEVHNH